MFSFSARRSCHSGVMKAEGWVVPVDKLIETAQIRITDDNVYHAVGRFLKAISIMDRFYLTEQILI